MTALASAGMVTAAQESLYADVSTHLHRSVPRARNSLCRGLSRRARAAGRVDRLYLRQAPGDLPQGQPRVRDRTRPQTWHRLACGRPARTARRFLRTLARAGGVRSGMRRADRPLARGARAHLLAMVRRQELRSLHDAATPRRLGT